MDDLSVQLHKMDQLAIRMEKATADLSRKRLCYIMFAWMTEEQRENCLKAQEQRQSTIK